MPELIQAHIYAIHEIHEIHEIHSFLIPAHAASCRQIDVQITVQSELSELTIMQFNRYESGRSIDRLLVIPGLVQARTQRPLFYQLASG